MTNDVEMRKPFVHHRLSQSVDPPSMSLYMLLILRATNLCKQLVTGSNPVTSTNFGRWVLSCWREVFFGAMRSAGLWEPLPYTFPHHKH
jgi:hypothetical protein